MNFDDFKAEDDYGVCVTIPRDFAPDYMKDEVILSQCMIDGTLGARKAVEQIYDQVSQGGPVGMRFSLNVTMAEQEVRMPGMLVTGKGNGAVATMKREYGFRRNLPRWKVPAALRGLEHLTALYAAKNAPHRKQRNGAL